MADISAFPTLTEVLVAGSNTFTFTAGEAMKAGQVVGIAASGVSGQVVLMDATAGETAIGVALIPAASGAPVTVAMMGCIVNVANADDTTGIDAGDYLEQNDNAVKGTVSAAAVTATGAATATLNNTIIGIAIDDIAGGATGRMMVLPMSMTRANSS